MLFGYRCTLRDGSVRDGLLDAIDEGQARAELGKRGWHIVRLAPVQQVRRTTEPVVRAAVRSASERKLPQLGLRLSLAERSLLLAQVSTLAEAGIPITRAFEVVGQAGSPGVREVCTHLARGLQGGARISEAMASVPRSFPPVVIGLTRVGEETGRMVTVLHSLSVALARDLAAYQRLAAALAYPVFALTACALLLALLVGVMLPQVVPLLPKTDLPWATRLVMAVDLRPIFALGFVITVLGALAARTPEGAVTLREGFFRFGHPRRALWTRLARSLGLMLASGMGTLQALQALQATSTGCGSVDEALHEVEVGVEGGLTLADALEASPAVPRALVRLLGASEEVGRPEQFLHSYAELGDLQLESEREAFLTLLEPGIVLGMGMIVGFVVTAVFLPLYGSLV